MQPVRHSHNKGHENQTRKTLKRPVSPSSFNPPSFLVASFYTVLQFQLPQGAPGNGAPGEEATGKLRFHPHITNITLRVSGSTRHRKKATPSRDSAGLLFCQYFRGRSGNPSFFSYSKKLPQIKENKV